MKLKMIASCAVLAVVMLVSCKEKGVDPVAGADAETNNWIEVQMKFWYYWNDKMPAKPSLNQTPEKFFDGLLYKFDAATRPDGDRFSWIQSSADELKASLSGSSKSTGMHYKLNYYPAGSKDVIGVVLYTLPGSPAAKAGLRRGDVFTAVDGIKLNDSNYSKLLANSDSLTLSMASVNDQLVVADNGTKRRIVPQTLQEDPVYYDTLFQYGAEKVGYLVYHQFIPSPNGSSAREYDQKLTNVINRFKTAGVTNLILDLRYNPGGYVSSATHLASLIGKGTANDIFYYKEYNETATASFKKQFGESYFYEKFFNYPQSIGGNLKNVYVLVSSRTASASELVINGLKPFMPVVLVGSKTVGKNVGSVTVSDSKGKIKWGLQPIVSKSLNSKHESDYATGFTPDFAASEGIRIYAYGDTRDPLLATALEKITGSPVLRQAARARVAAEPVEIGSTIAQKAGGSNMFFDR